MILGRQRFGVVERAQREVHGIWLGDEEEAELRAALWTKAALSSRGRLAECRRKSPLDF
jgi:hypothetical protein